MSDLGLFRLPCFSAGGACEVPEGCKAVGVCSAWDQTLYLKGKRPCQVLPPPVEISLAIDIRRKYERDTKALRTHVLLAAKVHPPDIAVFKGQTSEVSKTSEV
jgi:hypothetical protein